MKPRQAGHLLVNLPACLLAGVMAVACMAAACPAQAQAAAGQVIDRGVRQAGSQAGSPAQPDDPRQQLQDVMSDPLFSHWRIRQERSSPIRLRDMSLDQKIAEHLKPIGDLWSSFVDWLLKRPSRQGPSLSLPSADGWAWDLATMLKIAGWVLVTLAVLALAWLLWVKRRSFRGVISAAPASRQAMDAAMAQGDALVATSDAWAARAVELAQARDMRLAFRAMYLALLSGLHDAGHIHYRAQRTNWMYVTSFRGPAESRDDFADLTDRFDAIWYGLHEPDAASFQAMRRRIDALLRRPAS